MKQDDKLYEEWLADIRSRQPVISSPEELTASILQQVSRLPRRKKRKRLLIGSWLSGVAAGLLLCLLVSEALFTPGPYGVKEAEEYHLQENHTYSLPQGWEKMRLSEKSEYLSDQYIRLRQQRQSRVMELRKKTY